MTVKTQVDDFQRALKRFELQTEDHSQVMKRVLKLE
jgi:hypothetical protein